MRLTYGWLAARAERASQTPKPPEWKPLHLEILAPGAHT